MKTVRELYLRCVRRCSAPRSSRVPERTSGTKDHRHVQHGGGSPGHVLGGGTYVFKRVNGIAVEHVVQIWNEDETNSWQRL